MTKTSTKEAKKAYVELYKIHGSSLCEIKTLMAIFGLSREVASHILQHEFLEDAIEKIAQ